MVNLLMATSKKPRKPYKQKPAGIPLNASQKLRLELASRAHIDALYRGELTEDGWATLWAHFNLVKIALNMPLTESLDALQSIAKRADAKGAWGATGDERKLLIEQYNQHTPELMKLHDSTINQAIAKVQDYVIRMTA